MQCRSGQAFKDIYRITSGTDRRAIAHTNRANVVIEMHHRRVWDALPFPEGFRVSKNYGQWFMQSTKLSHSLDTTRTNVYFHFGAGLEVLL